MTESGWVFDYCANSPCIDAGDPGDSVGGETQPHGDKINMGAYGGTAQASKSPGDYITEAFPYEETPKYMIRDRDAIYGEFFQQRIKNIGIKEVVIAPSSPWQNPYCERLIGSIRRECLDHMIILKENHLRCILDSYFDYYHNARTRLSLDRNSPVPRDIEPPAKGKVISIPQVGGLHHRYSRVA